MIISLQVQPDVANLNYEQTIVDEFNSSWGAITILS
jgi:hypothetical protein